MNDFQKEKGFFFHEKMIKYYFQIWKLNSY